MQKEIELTNLARQCEKRPPRTGVPKIFRFDTSFPNEIPTTQAIRRTETKSIKKKKTLILLQLLDAFFNEYGKEKKNANYLKSDGF